MKLVAKTQNQKDYIRGIRDNDVTLCVGQPGTGKTFIAIGYSLQLLKKGEIDKIYLSRPMESTGGRDFPFLKGDMEDKIAPYMRPLTHILHKFMEPSDLAKLIRNDNIEFLPIELMRGMTFDNCTVIIDEAQNIDHQQAVMSITRMGENCRMIYTGDLNQSDIYVDSGLRLLVENLKKDPDLAFYIKMLDEDVQRSPKISKILKALHWKGNI